MKVGVVIVTYNSGRDILECLESLKRGDSCDEIVVVDNNSRDDTVLKLKGVKGIKVVCNAKNVGFSAANNVGAEKAKGDYILFLNPDTVVGEDALRGMVNFMEKNTSVGAATCKVVLPSGKLDGPCKRSFPTPWNSFCHIAMLDKMFPKSRLFGSYHLTYVDEDKVQEVDAISGSFFLVRRNVFDKVGGWDEDYFLYGEDIDLCYRITEKGWKVAYCPKWSVVHKKGGSSLMSARKLAPEQRKRREESIRHFYEAMKIFYRKHCEGKYALPVGWLVKAGISAGREVSLFLNKVKGGK